jgi:hypothetical protein
MSDEERAALICASFLYLNDFISDSVHSRIHKNVQKYMKKSKIAVTPELLDSVTTQITGREYANLPKVINEIIDK